MPITHPEATEYKPYYSRYIDEVKENDLLAAFRSGSARVNEFVKNISGDKGGYRYAENKWTVNEVLIHVMDCERVFSHRALRFARNDKTALPGFDEDAWAPESNAAGRSLASILSEYNTVRNATIALFESFNEEAPLRMGEASNSLISVRALGYCICGHEIHHLKVIREKYL